MNELDLSVVETLRHRFAMVDSENRLLYESLVSSIQKVETTQYDFVIVDANDRILYGHSPLRTLATPAPRDFELEAIINRGIAKAYASIDPLRADKVLHPVVAEL